MFEVRRLLRPLSIYAHPMRVSEGDCLLAGHVTQTVCLMLRAICIHEVVGRGLVRQSECGCEAKPEEGVCHGHHGCILEHRGCPDWQKERPTWMQEAGHLVSRPCGMCAEHVTCGPETIPMMVLKVHPFTSSFLTPICRLYHSKTCKTSL